MFKFLKDRKKKDNKGFTLVELVIVVAILAILVGLLAPQYTKYVEKSRKAADVNNMDEIVKAVQVYAVEGALKSTTSAANDVSATIVIGDSSTTCTDNIKNGVAEYVPDYANVKRKSNQWGGNPTANITIDKEGGVKVNYEPAAFATEMSRSAKPASTPPSNQE